MKRYRAYTLIYAIIKLLNLEKVMTWHIKLYIDNGDQKHLKI